MDKGIRDKGRGIKGNGRLKKKHDKLGFSAEVRG